MSKALKEALDKVAPTAREVMVLKASGKREVFNPEKLSASLLRSGASPKVTESVVEHVQAELYNNVTTNEIYRHAFDLLRKMEGSTARKYSLRRAVMDLGPSGFPFEKFVAEIFRAKGYETKTGEMVLGGCVSHEVDVVAWNEKELVMVEAKFHNELGTKSDLKVVLYIKARFDDLQENVFNYGGKDRNITDSWLVTNTKFSSTAIHYSECKGLTLIGWNYPRIGNLQDLIEEEALHPITCLGSLSSAQKKVLFDAHIVLCSNILKDPDILKRLFGAKFDSVSVLEEIEQL